MKALKKTPVRKLTLEQLRKVGSKLSPTGKGIKMQSTIAARRPMARRRYNSK